MKTGLILCALLLTACCSRPAPEVAQGPAEATLRIGPQGVAGLEGQAPFTLPAIERAFSGFDVVSMGDAEGPVFHVREPGTEVAVFIVSPDWTRGYIGAVSAKIPGAPDMQAGVTPFSALPDSLARACTSVPAMRDGPVRCETSLSAGTLRLEFPAGRGDPVLEQIAYFPRAPSQ